MTFIDSEVRTLVKCCHIKYSTRVPWGFFSYYEIWRCPKEMFLNPPLHRIVFQQFFTGVSSQLSLLLAHHHLPAHVLPPKFICIHLIRLSNCTLLTTEYASWRLVSQLHHQQPHFRSCTGNHPCFNRRLHSECQAKKHSLA